MGVDYIFNNLTHFNIHKTLLEHTLEIIQLKLLLILKLIIRWILRVHYTTLFLYCIYYYTTLPVLTSNHVDIMRWILRVHYTTLLLYYIYHYTTLILYYIYYYSTLLTSNHVDLQHVIRE